uniref:Uncharacterized protein n=1 Tax=Oryza brachyantha TaxID=4533 RepID=J3MJ56_ORYBR
SYPLLKNKIPCLPTQRVADQELDDVQWQVKDDVVKPDTPAQPHPMPLIAANAQLAYTAIRVAIWLYHGKECKQQVVNHKKMMEEVSLVCCPEENDCHHGQVT